MTPPDDTLYFTPGSCALATLAALEETGHPYRAVCLSMGPDGAGDEAFARLSPLRQVPVLLTPGGPVRETAAVFAHLGQRHPQSAILPAGGDEAVLAQRWLGFLAGSVHPAFRPLWRSARWVGADPAAQQVLRAHAGAYLGRVAGALAEDLRGRDWALAKRSAIDFYIHVFTRWLGKVGGELPEALAAHHARTAALPAMQRAVAVEAETSGRTP